MSDLSDVSDLHFRSFVERYVATLFAQCRRIACVFEVNERAEQAERVPTGPLNPDFDELEDFKDFELPESVSESWDLVCSVRPPAPRPPAQPSQPSQPAHAPHGPRGPRGRAVCASLATPGPWASTSEAQRLLRLREPRAPPRWHRRKEDEESTPRQKGDSSEDEVSKRPRRPTLGGVKRRSLKTFQVKTAQAESGAEEEGSPTRGDRQRSRSIFALPGEDDEASRSRSNKKVSSVEHLSLRSLRAKRRGVKRFSSKGFSQAKRKAAHEANLAMEAQFLERFRTTREDDLEKQEPATSQKVLLLHQLAFSVGLSFDDARMAKAAFAKQDTQGRDLLEFEDFIQAVLELHRNINETSTVATLNQCENFFRKTFPAEQGGTIDLVQFLEWYSSYSFHEKLLLSPDMRNLRRLSKQYGVSWEEVDKVKRLFDSVDTDHSGEVDFKEFTALIRKVLQVPADLEMPPNRARHFWRQLDIDGNGKADFSEFFPWWLKYFNPKDGESLLVKPFEDFYRSVRNLRNPDPLLSMSKYKTKQTPALPIYEDPAQGALQRNAERRISALLCARRPST